MVSRRLDRLKPKVEKICDVCNKSFITSFSNRKRCSKECSKKYHDTVYLPYVWTHGISLEIYNLMFAEQEGKCLICKRHQSNLSHKLNVDHCHKTGKIRGLLCNQCNQSLGLMKENKEAIKSMLEYVS